MGRKAFTLIEVLVVVTIIVILSVLLLSFYDKALEKGDMTRAKADMANISKILIVAQAKSSKPLRDMGNGCYQLDACLNKAYRQGANYPLDLRNIPTSDPCYVASTGLFQNIVKFTQGTYSYDVSNPPFARDPWGSPYIIEPIDGCPHWFTGKPQCNYGGCYPDPPYPTCCQNDDIYSVGPDGLDGTADDFSYGPIGRAHLSRGADDIANTNDDDLGGIVPRAYSGNCTDNNPDATHASVWCDGM